jgi:hypothetical protein
VLTNDEVVRVAAAWTAARAAARAPALAPALDAALAAARDVEWAAAWTAARAAALDEAWTAARAAALDAATAVVTWDLATEDGPYTIAQRDALIAPWVAACGMPDGLV